MGTGKYSESKLKIGTNLTLAQSTERQGRLLVNLRTVGSAFLSMLLFCAIIYPQIAQATYITPDAPIVDGMAIHPVTGELEPAYIKEGITYTQDTATGEFSGYLFRYETATHLYFAFAQSVFTNDNTYGTNSIGWGTKGHTFKDLWSSDHAWVEMYNCSNQLVLKYAMDYGTWNSTTGKLTTSGISGGDGQIQTGNPVYIDQIQTSLTWNFNHATPTWPDKSKSSPPRLLVNDYSTGTWVNPNTPWIYEILYEWRVSKAAFGSSGFCKLKIMEVHNSPTKKGEVNPAPEPVVSVALTADPPGGTDLVYGGVIEYFVHYKNPGTATLTNVVITDPLSVDLTSIVPKNAGIYNFATHSVTWDIGTLAPGASGVVSFFAAAEPGPGVSVVMNKAYLSATSPNGNFTVPTNTLYHPVLLSATVNAGLSAIPPSGTLVTHTQPIELILSIDTSGNLDVTNTIAKLKLDPGLDSIEPLDKSGIYNPVTHDVTWNLGTVPPGTFLELKVLTKVAMTTPVGITLTNTAQVTSDLGVSSPPPVHHPVVAPDYVQVQIGLDCSPMCGQQVNPSQPVQYLLTFSTQGVANLTNATVTLPVDKGLTQISASDGGTYNGNNRVLTWNVGTIPPYTTQTFEIDADVIASATEGTVITEVATITATEDTATSDPVEYIVTIPPIVTPKIALSATPVSGSKVLPGANIDLKVNVAATGTTNLTNAVVTLKLDPNLTNIDPKLGTYNSATHSVVWNVGTVVPGITQSLFVSGMVKNNGTVPEGTVLTEQATVVAAQGSATSAPVKHTVQLPKAVTPTILLQSAPTPGSSVTPSQTINLYVTVGATGNISLTNAKAVLLVDPTNLVNVVPQNGGVYLSSPPRVEWTIGNLSPGTSMVLTAAGAVKSTATNGTVLTEKATLTGDQGSVTSNTITHTVGVPSAYPTATLTPTPASGSIVAPGSALTLKLAVKANGTSNLSNVVAKMVLDPGVTYTNIGDGGSYDEATRTVTWTWSSQSKGTTKTVTVDAKVNTNTQDGQVLVETAAVTSSQGSASTVPANHVVAVPKNVAPKLTLWSAPVSGSPVLNDDFIYFYLLAEAIGNTNLTNAVVTLKLDSDMTEIRPKSDGIYNPLAHTITWNLGTLSPQQPMSLVASGELLPDLADGTEIKTEATITADQGTFVANPVFHYVVEFKNVVPIAELFATPPSGSSVLQNQTVEFDLHVTASGNINMTNTVAQLVLDPGFTNIETTMGGSPLPETPNTIQWILGTVAPNTTVVVGVTAEVSPGTNDGDVLITEATVTATQGTAETNNVTHTVTIPKVVNPTVALEATPPSGSTVIPGGKIDLLVHAGAVGNTLLTDAVLTLTLADHYVNISAPGGFYNGTTQPRTVTWKLGSIPPGSTLTLPVSGTVATNAANGAILVEQATLVATQGTVTSNPVNHVVAIPKVNTTGKWAKAVADPTSGTISGTGTNKISWGTPVDNNPSSYVFTGLSDVLIPTDGTLFDLGSFTHNNFRITGTMLDSATLDVTLTGAINGSFTFKFDHWETPNTATPCGAGGAQPCPDLVSFVNSVSTASVMINGQPLVLEIVGFKQGTTLTESYLTLENKTNTAILVARLIPDPTINPDVQPTLTLLSTPPSGETVDPGSDLQLTLIVGAVGNTILTNSTVILNLDPAVVNVSVPTIPGVPDGVHDPVANTVTWNIANISPGEIATLYVNGMVSPAAMNDQVLTETATLVADQGTATAVPVQHTVFVPQAVFPVIGLQSIPESGSTVHPADILNLTIPVTAIGNTPLTNVTVTLVLDPWVDQVKPQDGGEYLTAPDPVVVWFLDSLEPNQVIGLHASVRVKPGAPEIQLVHGAHLMSDQGPATAMPVLHNVVIPLIVVPTVVLSADPPSGSTVTPSAPIALAVTIGATGNTNLTGTVAKLVIDPYLVFQSASDNGQYDAATRTITWNVGTVSPGLAVVRTVNTLVSPDAPDNQLLSDTATVSADQGAATASPVFHTVKIPKVVTPTAQLTADPATGNTLKPLDPLQLTIAANAVGNTPLTEAVISLALDPHVTFVQADSQGSYVSATHSVVWPAVSIVPGTSQNVTAFVNINANAPDTQIINHSGQVSATQGTAVTNTVTHTVTVPKYAVPTIELTSVPAPGSTVAPASTINLVVKLGAMGNTSVNNAVATVLLDPQFHNPVPGQEGTYDPATHSVFWTVDTLNPGDVVLRSIGGTVDPNAKDDDQLVETASVTSDSGNATANPVHHIVAVPKAVSPAITLTSVPPSGSSVAPNTLIDLTLVVTAQGNIPLTDAIVTLNHDALLVGINPENNGVHNAGAKTVTWSLPTLNPGQQATFIVHTTVSATAPDAATLIETASVTATQGSATSTPVTHTVAVPKVVSPSITLTADPIPGTKLNPQQPLALTLVVTANGNTDLTNVVVTLSPDAFLTALVAQDDGVVLDTDHKVTWTLTKVTPGSPITLHATGIVDGAVPDKTWLKEQASLTSDQGPATATPVYHPVTLPTPVVNLALTLDAIPPSGSVVKINDTLTLPLTLTATGNTASTNTQVILQVDPRLTNIAAVPEATHDSVAHTVTWWLGDVSPGTTVPLQVTATVHPDAPNGAKLIEVASAVSDQATADAAPVHHIVKKDGISVETTTELTQDTNGDGVVSTGDHVTVCVDVSNTGTTEWKDLIAILTVDHEVLDTTEGGCGIGGSTPGDSVWSLCCLPSGGQETQCCTFIVAPSTPETDNVIELFAQVSGANDTVVAQHSSLPLDFQWVPQVTTVVPSSVPLGYFGEIELFGDNFPADLTVELGGTITVVDIYVESVNHARVTIDVPMTQPLGTLTVLAGRDTLEPQAATLTVSLPAPQVIVLSPMVIPPGETTTITVSGIWLGAPLAIQTSAGTVSNIQSIDFNTATFDLLAPQSPQEITVAVTTPHGTATPEESIAVYGPTEQSCVSVELLDTQQITIVGHGFQGDELVSLGPGITVGDLSISDTIILATVEISDTAPLGLCPLEVSSPSTGYSVTVNDCVSVITPEPTIDALLPPAGSPGSVVTVTILGDNLYAPIGASIDGLLVTSITPIDPTTAVMEVIIPDWATIGHHDLTLSTPWGSFQFNDSFTVSKFYVDSLTPAVGPLGKTVTVNITGSGFEAGMTMSLGDDIGIMPLMIEVDIDTPYTATAEVIIAPDATVGPRHAVFTLQDQVWMLQNAFVVENVQPIITQVKPNVVSPGGIGTINVVGTGFLESSVVTIENTVPVNTLYWTDTLLKPTVQLPTSPGQYDVTVTNTTLTTTSKDSLVVYGATECVDAVLLQGETAVITVLGFGFSLAPKASLHKTVTVSQVTKKSATQLELVVSVAADAPVGTYPLTLTQSIGALSATFPTCLTVLPSNGQAAAPPTILEITPSTVAAGTKVDVFLKGTNLDINTTVDLGPDITITAQTTLSDTLAKASLSVSSIAKAGPVDVVVTTDAGETIVPGGLTITQQPLVITSLSPSLLTRGTDDVITLNGTGLTSATTIQCGGAGKIISQKVLGNTKMTFGIKTTLTPGLYDCTLSNGTETIVLTNALTVFGLTDITPAFVGKGNGVAVLVTGGLPSKTLLTVDEHIQIYPGLVIGKYTTATIIADYEAALGSYNVTATLGKLNHTLSGGLTVTPGSPVVSLVSPSAMELNQAQEIEITGFNLDGCTATITGAITSGVVTATDSTKLVVWAMSTETAGLADLRVDCPTDCLEMPGLLRSVETPPLPLPHTGSITITLPGTSATYPALGETLDIQVQAAVTDFVLGSEGSIQWYVDGIFYGEQTDTQKVTLANITPGMHTITAVLVDKNKQPVSGKKTKATSKITVGKSCTQHSDCDDGNSCSKEYCKSGYCQYQDSDVFKAKFCCQTDIECPYAAKCKDHQCVSCEVDEDCFDGVACTLHKCNNINNTCVNKNLIGCCILDADCNDNNPCTKDSCADHQCVHGKESISCCETQADCDDGNPCTKDYCYKNECKLIEVPLCCTKDDQCSDNKDCTDDWCDPITLRCDHKVTKACPCGKPGAPKCCTGNIDCFDNDACTKDTCDVDSGICTNKPTWCCKNTIDCDDGIWCNVDACINGECRYGPNPIFDVPGIWGTFNQCCVADPTQAVKWAAYLDCDDNDPCTLDVCDPITQLCDHTETDDPNCCTWPSECDDGDPATINACVEAQCQFTPNDQYCASAADCDDNHGCTVDICGADNTCTYYLLDDCCISDTQCGDKDPCTLDICNPQTKKCENPPNPKCCYANEECDDNNGCTADQCINNACRHTVTPNCCATVADCQNGPACTSAACIAGKCVFTPVANPQDAGCCATHGDCQDDDPCTNDLCVLGKCLNKPSLSCCYTALDCDDGNTCTKDMCIFGKCKNVSSVNCCSTSGDCNDNNECTDDTCVAGACQFTQSQSCAESLPYMTDYGDTSVEASGWTWVHEGVDKPGPWVLANGKAVFAPAKTAAPYRSYWISPPIDTTGAAALTAQFDLTWVGTGNPVELSIKVRKSPSDQWVEVAKMEPQDSFTKLWSVVCTTQLAGATAAQVAIVVDSSGAGGFQVVLDRFMMDAGSAPTFVNGSALPLITVATGGKMAADLYVQDADGDVITFLLVGAPTWAQLKGYTQAPSGAYVTQLVVQPPLGTTLGTAVFKARALDGVLESDIAVSVKVY